MKLKNQKIKILSKGLQNKVKGGNVAPAAGCACCICSPDVKGAGSVTATNSGS